MSRGEDKVKLLQFSLRAFFGLAAIVGMEIWLLQHGIDVFIPLFVAIGLLGWSVWFTYLVDS